MWYNVFMFPMHFQKVKSNFLDSPGWPLDTRLIIFPKFPAGNLGAAEQ